jgi:hypothetical protein
MTDLPTICGHHAVQFYESDGELASTVVPYLAEGAAVDEALVVISDEAHRREFESGLRLQGVDVDGARRAGTLVALDARETLEAFTVGGKLDRGVFAGLVGGVLRSAADGATGVRAYGEMVSLLWGERDLHGALELERFWNTLAGELEFSLFCAYPARSVSSPHDREAVHEVCELHSLVVPASDANGGRPQTASMPLPAERDACTKARRFVRSTLRRWGHSDALVDRATLVSSELAANAVLHAGSPFTVELHAGDAMLRVSVSDEGPVPHSAWGVQTAHGLSLIEALCGRWGVAPTTGGKTVWAELPLVPVASANGGGPGGSEPRS